ncbi:cytochrome P450 [Streptomyces sp. CB00455]|uniref:cytochrome P450 n=1 Tax=Streptomyces sp. CB00455 TaxID=1703927 RepID=UPI001300DCF6|nr:cytochrome P450 [Streptomyces sp. CB00455]
MPLAGRGPAVPGLGAEAADRRTSVKSSSFPASAAAVTATAATLVRGLVPARPRPGAVRTSAAALRALRARHGDAPVLVRARSGRTVLVLLAPADIDRFYAEPVGVLADDPPPGTTGLGCPHGGSGPEQRRTGAEALAAAVPARPSCAPFLTAVAEEARHLTASASASGTLELARVRHAMGRAARRIVLGDAAAADEELAGRIGQNSARSSARAARRIREYVRQADPHTLIGQAFRHTGPADPLGACAPFDASDVLLAADPFGARGAPGMQDRLDGRGPAPGLAGSAGVPDPVGQAQRWLLAMDSLPATLLRTLLLLGAHPAEQHAAAAEAAGQGARGDLPRLWACVRETLRLYPVVPDLIRLTRTETEWRGVRYPAGTAVLLPAAFHQRDPERVPAADVFVPQRWKNPGADQDIRMAPFGHGPGRCPGDRLGLLLTAAFCAEVLRGHRISGTRPVLDPVGPLPAELDPHGIRLTLTRR